MMADDKQLLDKYKQERSESAFGQLVAKNIDLVYATALRVVSGDAHLAQDITQTVFIHLARKAWSLPSDVVLPDASHSIGSGSETGTREQVRFRTIKADLPANSSVILVNPIIY